MSSAELTTELADGVLVARVLGEVDMANVDLMRGALGRSLSAQLKGVVVDLTDTLYLDSAGINLLLGLREQLAMRGLTMRIVVPPESGAHDALRYAGVLEALGACATVADAQACISDT